MSDYSPIIWPEPEGGNRFDKYTVDAIDATIRAGDEARKLAQDYIGTEMIIIGLLDAAGLASTLLKERGATIEDARAKLERIIGKGYGAREGPLPFSIRLTLAFSLAEACAKRHDRNSVDSIHLLVGVLDAGGQCITLVRNLGIDPATLIAQSEDLASKQS